MMIIHTIQDSASGADGENRTLTGLLLHAPEACASTNSATSAYLYLSQNKSAINGTEEESATRQGVAEPREEFGARIPPQIFGSGAFSGNIGWTSTATVALCAFLVRWALLVAAMNARYPEPRGSVLR